MSEAPAIRAIAERDPRLLPLRPALRSPALVRSMLPLAFLLLACHPSTPEVVVYVSVDQPTAAPVLARYEALTGVRVMASYDVEASKTTGLVQRLLAEHAHPAADVFWSSEVVQTAWLGEQGALAAWSPPAAADVPAAFRDPVGTWTGVGLRARVLLVNTERAPAERAVAGLDTLLDPAWPPEEVAMALPLFGTSATAAAALYETRGPEAARAWYEAVRDRGVRVVDGNATVRDLVARGDVTLGLTDSDDARGAERAGAPVRAVLPPTPAEGRLMIPGTVALVAGGPNPDQGRALVDWLAGGEAEQRLLEEGFFTATVREAPGEAAVDWGAVAAWLPRVREELREVFLR